MSQEAVKQSLSALVDNEADELELRRVLQAMSDPQLRETWSRYQVARSALHNKPMHTGVDLSARIMAAIDAEPALAQSADASDSATRVSGKTPWVARIAVAASVTLMVLGGVRFYNQDGFSQEAMMAQGEQRLPAISSSHTSSQSPAVLASYNAQTEQAEATQAATEDDAWYERRLPSYLRQHAQQAGASTTESGLPYARAASLEGQ